MKSRLILGPARKTGQALPWSVPSEAFFFDAATEFAEAEDCNSNIEFGSEKVFKECVDCVRQIAQHAGMGDQLCCVRIVPGLDGVEDTCAKFRFDETGDET